jgi:uncharacterized membrane protein YqjE
MSQPSGSSDDDAPTRAGGIRALLHHAAGLVQARLSLAVIELSEARDAFITVVILAIAALVTTSLALIALSALVIMLLWDAMGLWIIVVVALFYAVLGGWLLRSAIRLVREGRLGLPHTLAELRQDRESLWPRDAP